MKRLLACAISTIDFVAASVCFLGCGQPPEPKPSSPTSIDAPAVEPQESTIPEVTPAPGPAPAPEPPPAEPGPAVSPAPAAAPSAPPLTPPGVTAKSIGMHIGGGPNDAAAKAPFLRTIEGKFDEYVECTRFVPAGERKGTFGVDLLVGKDGGHPEVSNPRTGLPGDGFKACIVREFELLSFDKPKRGATKLSYSLRFDVK